MLLYSNRTRVVLIVAVLVVWLALMSVGVYAGDCEGVGIGTCP